MSPDKRQAFIVSHTHWDREWYLPFNRFRVNLVETVGKVLDRLESDPDFTHFLLDGQTCVLEDYLAAVPGDTQRVRNLVRRGALASGPWYILPDEFLVSGEATVRNLILGRRTGAAWGPVQKVGYMPDSFGHVAQLPQILRLAGLDSFVFTRGLGDEAPGLGWLFRWQAPDETEVLAVNQCEGLLQRRCPGLQGAVARPHPAAGRSGGRRAEDRRAAGEDGRPARGRSHPAEQRLRPFPRPSPCWPRSWPPCAPAGPKLISSRPA